MEPDLKPEDPQGDSGPSERIAFLERHGADEMGHSRESLLRHLLGVRALLVRWGARQAVIDGGLFHSVYVTESYRAAMLPLALRGEVRNLIGEEAERLAWLFGVRTLESFYPNLARLEGPFSVQDRFSGEQVEMTTGELADQCDLMVANWLEQRPRVPASQRFIRREEFAAMKPRLLPAAWDNLAEAYGFPR